jgi:hypothetical protein
MSADPRPSGADPGEDAQCIDFLLDALRAERLTAVVDVGANPMFEPPYVALTKRRACTFPACRHIGDRSPVSKRHACAPQLHPFSLSARVWATPVFPTITV